MENLFLLLPDEILPRAAPDHTGPVVIELVKGRRPGRGRWWRADKAGYTNCPGNVGIYSAIEAAGICASGVAYPVDAVALLGLVEKSAALLKQRIEAQVEKQKISEYHCGLCYVPRFRCECPVT